LRNAIETVPESANTRPTAPSVEILCRLSERAVMSTRASGDVAPPSSLAPVASKYSKSSPVDSELALRGL
jgi:hypothetical protein